MRWQCAESGESDRDQEKRQTLQLNWKVWLYTAVNSSVRAQSTYYRLNSTNPLWIGHKDTKNTLNTKPVLSVLVCRWLSRFLVCQTLIMLGTSFWLFIQQNRGEREGQTNHQMSQERKNTHTHTHTQTWNSWLWWLTNKVTRLCSLLIKQAGNENILQIWVL